MQNLIQDLTQKLLASSIQLEGYNIFIIEKEDTFRLIDSRWNKTSYTKELSFAIIKKLERGQILAAFAKLEFLVNNCILLCLFSKPNDYDQNIKYFKNISKEKANIISEFKSNTPITSSSSLHRIQEISFQHRLSYCLHLQILDYSLDAKLRNLIDSRNFLAHEWDEKLAEYNGSKLTKAETLKQFSEDLVGVFEYFINKYKELQKATNYICFLRDFINK